MVLAKQGFSKKVPGRSTQIYEILKRISDGELSEDDVRGFTLAYDDVSGGKSGLSEKELAEQQYQLSSMEKMNVAYNKTLKFEPVEKKGVFARQIANALYGNDENLPEWVKLQIVDNEIRVDLSDLEKNNGFRNRIVNLTRKIKRRLLD